jgi:hypothetical protein
MSDAAGSADLSLEVNIATKSIAVLFVSYLQRPFPLTAQNAIIRGK